MKKNIKKILVGSGICLAVAIIVYVLLLFYMDQKYRKDIENYKDYITNQPLKDKLEEEKSQPNE